MQCHREYDNHQRGNHIRVLPISYSVNSWCFISIQSWQYLISCICVYLVCYFYYCIMFVVKYIWLYEGTDICTLKKNLLLKLEKIVYHIKMCILYLRVRVIFQLKNNLKDNSSDKIKIAFTFLYGVESSLRLLICGLI